MSATSWWKIALDLLVEAISTLDFAVLSLLMASAPIRVQGELVEYRVLEELDELWVAVASIMGFIALSVLTLHTAERPARRWLKQR